MSSPTFSIAGRDIGPDFPPYIIAEISCNHAYASDHGEHKAGKSYERCEELVRQAAAAGCDAVKLQTYLADTITMKCDTEHFQITGAKVALWNQKTLHALYDENSTPWEWTQPLMKLANDLGMVLFTSPFDESAVDYLENINVPAYKIASFENTDHGLLRKIAMTGKPVIMSTGMASVADIDESVGILRATNPNIQLAILKCTSAYPADPADANLCGIQMIAKTWGVVPGLSDHTVGPTVPIVAATLGACIFEKHIILDRSHPTADAPFSLTGAEFKDLVDNTRVAKLTIGKPHVAFGKSSKESLSKKWRRSIFVTKAMKAGEAFVKGVNCRSIRPAAGLHTRYWSEVEGATATRDIARGEPTDWGMLSVAKKE